MYGRYIKQVSKEDCYARASTITVLDMYGVFVFDIQ